jgi:hypothetical protein
MDNLIAQDADLIEICSDDLVRRLRSNRPILTLPHEAADRIEQLEREKAVVSDLWEQQKEIALDYLTDCNKAAEHIEAQAAEIERLREALTKISLLKWNSMTQGCNAAREASNIASAALAGKAEQ